MLNLFVWVIPSGYNHTADIEKKINLQIYNRAKSNQGVMYYKIPPPPTPEEKKDK